MLIRQAALAAVALLYSFAAAAALSIAPDCIGIPGAIADGKSPDHCAIGSVTPDDPVTEANAINTVFADELGTASDPFFFVGKYEIEGSFEYLPGYSLTATAMDAEEPWDYMFQLLTDYDGQVVDFVLMVKQPDTATNGPPVFTNVAYAWEGLVLDIDGFYNSFNSDYSHISAFIRGVDVSEPAPLALLGLGLLGVALLRRRTS
jgi:hypothetical protein